MVMLLMICLNARSQQSSDYGLFIGMAQEHRHTILPLPAAGPGQPAFGAYYRYNLNPRYAVRAGVNQGISSSFNFKDTDVHGLIEFNFLPMDPRKETSHITTYAGLGLGIYQATLAIPFNLGVKYQVTPDLGLTLEWDLRKTFEGNPLYAGSDIPSVILSGWHSFIGISAGYTILKRCKTCPFYESSRKRN